MRLIKQLGQPKILLTSLVLLTASVIAACSTASKYTICVMDPVHNYAVCNKTGNQADNFKVPFTTMENYIAMPPKDAEAILQKLKICEQKRSGD